MCHVGLGKSAFGEHLNFFPLRYGPEIFRDGIVDGGLTCHYPRAGSGGYTLQRGGQLRLFHTTYSADRFGSVESTPAILIFTTLQRLGAVLQAIPDLIDR